MNDFMRIMGEQEAETRRLMRKYPKLTMVVNCFIAVMFFLAIISIIVWQAQVRTEKIEAYRAAQVAAAQEAERLHREQEQQAALLAAQREEANRREDEILLMAKLLSGIDSFVDKYGYSDNDIRTYGECVINRVLSNRDGFPNTITEVILQKDQWVGFSESNVVIQKYYQIAKTIITEYYNGTPRPCSSDYCWAELNRDGIWLKKEFNNDPHLRMWRY